MNGSTTTRLGIAVLLMLSISGCAPSVEGYVKDDEARRDILGKCASLELDPLEDERCGMAAEAEAIAARDAMSSMFE